MRAILTALSVLVLAGATALFVLFLADTERLGGDALSGEEGGGRYFVADHGRRTEVAGDAWQRNRVLGIAAFSALPLGMAAGAYLLFAQVLRRMVYRRAEEEVAAGAKRVQASGAAVAEVRTGGKLGWASFGGRLLRVTVHPGGLVVKPTFLPAFGIARDRVRAVRHRKVWRVVDHVEIDHSSLDVPSPVVFTGTIGEPFVAALADLAP